MKSCNIGRGLGSRLSEETHSKPKPMIEIAINQFYGTS